MSRAAQLTHSGILLLGAAICAFGGALAYAQLGPDGQPLHTVAYRGYLEKDSEPLSDTADLTFRIFDSQAGGLALGDDIAVPGVRVTRGMFSVDLELDEALLVRKELWISVSIDGAAPLEPRQRLLRPHAINGVPPGTVAAYAASAPPDGWILCDGSEVSRAEYPALFAVLGTSWGLGDGSQTFNIPDLRGRTAIGAGVGLGLSPRSVGDTLGEETHTLTLAEMPSHRHLVPNLMQRVDGQSGVNGSSEKNDGAFNTEYTDYQGGNAPHNTMQPSVVLNYLIKY